jgi:hypothetical protein
VRVVHEACQHGHNSPGNQDARNPDACPDSVEQQIAWDFKEEVAEKENPSDKSELLAGDGQLLVHRQGSKADVDAVEKCNDVEKPNEGKNPDFQFPNRSALDDPCTDAGLVRRGHSSQSAGSSQSGNSMVLIKMWRSRFESTKAGYASGLKEPSRPALALFRALFPSDGQPGSNVSE